MRGNHLANAALSQWRMIIKKLVPYLDVILLFVFKTSTFNSQNTQYLEFFLFNQIDFICVSGKGFLEINSVFHKKGSFSSIPIIHKKAITTDTTID